LFQEISVDSPCLTNPAVTLYGDWEEQSSHVAARGFTCYHAPHASTYWSKYYDYTNCDVFNSYIQSGTGLCLNTTDYTNIVFFSVRLSTGSTMAMANATFRGYRNVTLASIHFDSDVAGNRRQEFLETFFELFPANQDRPLIACGDYNTFWEPANLRRLYQVSGYFDPLFQLSQTLQNPSLIVPSQPLTEGWYNSANHEGPIDHCLVPWFSAVPYLAFAKGNPSLYGWPNSTLTGVLDTGLWTRFPEIQGFDTNELARNSAQLCDNGSDHFSVVSTMIIL
jgi:hypothetical protein